MTFCDFRSLPWQGTLAGQGGYEFMLSCAMKNHRNLIIGLVFVLGINLYLRSFTINFPQLKDRARDMVEMDIREAAAEGIEKNYAQYSQPAKNKLLELAITDYKRIHKDEIGVRIQKKYLALKDPYQDAGGQTYLLELDCWNWARYTGNVLSLGRPGDSMVNGYSRDSLMLAPSGSLIMWNHFLFRFSAFCYRFFYLFWPLPLYSFLFYLPLLFAAVFFILLYFIGFRCGRAWGALIACLYLGFNLDFLQRSCAGWFDTDILNLLFPLLVVWFYAQGASGAGLRRRVAWILASAFALGVFSYTWTGWWFVLLVIAAYEFYTLANLGCAWLQFRQKDQACLKRHIFNLVIFLAAGYCWVLIFSGPEALNSIFFMFKEALGLNRAVMVSLWPNVYRTVSEIAKVNLEEVAGRGQEVVLFFLALGFLLAFFFRTIRQRKDEDFKREFAIMMTFWFIGLFYASLKGIRFRQFMHLPLSLSLGWGVAWFQECLKKRKQALARYLFLGVMCMLGILGFNNAYQKARTTFPLMNDTWHKLLTDMRNRAPKQAVFNSWWDYGAWFKSVAGRRVIFDGQSQNTPQAYWMARVFLSDNEAEAIAILRMLNNGGNTAYDLINRRIQNSLEAFLLLNRLIMLNPKEAKDALGKFLPEGEAEKVMGLIFNTPPEAYFIVDHSISSKMGAISYLGNWDFKKAYLAHNTGNRELVAAKERLASSGVKKEEIGGFLNESSLLSPEDLGSALSQRLKFHSSPISGKQLGDMVLFNNGFVYKPQEKRIYLYSPRLGKFRVPESLFIFENSKIEKVPYPDSDLKLSVLIFKAEEGYRAILLSPKLAQSLFTRLYFLGANGMKHFKPFIEEKAGSGYIRVFEIIWE